MNKSQSKYQEVARGDGLLTVATGLNSIFKYFNLSIFKSSFILIISLTSFFILPLSASASLTDGLVGHWTFDGKNNDWKINSTGYNNGNV